MEYYPSSDLLFGNLFTIFSFCSLSNRRKLNSLWHFRKIICCLIDDPDYLRYLRFYLPSMFARHSSLFYLPQSHTNFHFRY